MIESLKALFVVAVLSAGAFFYARMAFADVVAPATLARWRNLYLAVTAVAFLVPNYWLMLAAMAGAVLFFGARDKFKPAIYLLLLFAVPVASKTVPGFGGINNFLDLYPYNVLAVILLFPLLLRPNEVKGSGRGGLADAFFIAFALLMIVLAFRDASFTHGIRRSTAFILTAIAQYLIFSRIRWSVERASLATAALVIPLVALSGVAAAEVALGWHVYANAVQNWDVSTALRYSERSGFLRAYGSIFGPISFGLFLAVGLALAPALIAGARKKGLANLSIPAIGAGLLTTFSRGPWIGGGIAFAVYVATTKQAVRNLIRLAVAGAAGLALLAVTPFGGAVLSILPVIGEVEDHTIDYRQRLFEIGWRVVMQNPWFGSEGYMDSPAMQELIQGQGIIDIVNAYLRIALDSGIVGLSLYLGAVGFSLLAAFRAIGPARRLDSELASYCQAYFAALLGLTIILATTANTLAQIKEVTWILCGMCVGLARSVALEGRERETAPAAVEADAPKEAPPTNPPEPPPPPGRSLPPHLRQYVRR
jgi:O-antigen ligase